MISLKSITIFRNFHFVMQSAILAQVYGWNPKNASVNAIEFGKISPPASGTNTAFCTILEGLPSIWL